MVETNTRPDCGSKYAHSGVASPAIVRTRPGSARAPVETKRSVERRRIKSLINRRFI
jgi:hypothetical protein